MSLDEIKRITEAEKTAEDLLADARREGKLLISKAEQDGKDYAKRVLTEAEAAVRQLLEEAETAADRENLTKSDETKKFLSDLRAAAGAGLDESASIIVERIVNF